MTIYAAEPFFIVAAGFLTAIGLGLGALSSWLAGRRAAQAHERQTESDERRHGASLDDRAAERADRRERLREYYANEREREAAWRAGQQGAMAPLLRALGLGGLSGALAGAMGSPGAAPMPAGAGMADYQTLPVVSRPAPAMGQQMDFASLIPLLSQARQQQAPLPAGRIPGAGTGMLTQAPSLPAGMGGPVNIGGSNLVR